MSEPLEGQLEEVKYRTGLPEVEGAALVTAYLEANGISGNVDFYRRQVMAGLLDRRYHGSLLRWWYFGRGAQPPYSLTRPSYAQCSELACTEDARKVGFCRRHYERRRERLKREGAWLYRRRAT